MGVEHHLLALARIGPHEQHPAVAQPDMRHLHRHRRRRRSARARGSSRTGRPRPARSSAARRPPPSPLAPAARRPHTAAPRRSRPGSQARAAPRTPGPASAAPGSTAPRSPPAAGPAPHAMARPSAAAARPLVDELRLPGPQDLAHGVAGDVQLARDLPDRPAATRYSRRTRAIVSTPFIPQPTRPDTRTGSVRATRDRGSILDAYPAAQGQHSTPIHTTARTALPRASAG